MKVRITRVRTRIAPHQDFVDIDIPNAGGVGAIKHIDVGLDGYIGVYFANYVVEGSRDPAS